MKLKNIMLLVTAVGMTAMIQNAKAQVTLSQLASSGGSLTIGDKTFSNFGWTPSGAAGSQLNADAANLIVSAYIGNGVTGAVGVDYLDFSGFIGVDNTSGSANLLGDLLLKYTVTANPGSISMIDQQYTPNAVPATGQIIIGETVSANGTIVGNSTLTLNPSHLSDPPTVAGDNLVIDPSQSELSVIKDISITADPGSLVGLSDVQQSFHQVPEPTTVLAGALLLLPLGASALRILRKSRAA
jgi:hypothetical protein